MRSSVDLDPRVAANIPVGAFPMGVAVGEGAAWISVQGGMLVRIDPAGNDVSRIRVGGLLGDVAAGEGAIWVVRYTDASGSALVRIDPATDRIVAAIPIGPESVAVGYGAVWATAITGPGTGEVIRIDPSTNEIVARVLVDGDPRDLAVADGGVWVFAYTAFEGDTVVGASLIRIDPKTNRVAATVLEDSVPPGSGVDVPPAIFPRDGHVWAVTVEAVGSGDEPRTSAVEIDATTGAIVGAPLPLRRLFYPFAADTEGVWFWDGRVARLNVRTREVDEFVDVDDHAVDAALDPVTGTIWVANYRDSVTRIDLR